MIQNLISKRYGKLVVLRQSYLNGNFGEVRWLCRCDCGNEKIVIGRSLRDGRTNSCGCLRKENKSNLSHGMSNTIEYRSWQLMKNRCYNHKCEEYNYYGGRGISVCERWLESFENFFEDMGAKPSVRHSIDRYPNNNGNYEKSNCRWATVTQQANNRRKKGSHTFLELANQLK